MTVSSSTSRNEYNGNAVTTVFPYTFRILDEDHVAVYVGGVIKTITTDYTVSGVGDSGCGNITFLSAPASGTGNVVIIRSVPLTQETDYVENDPFPAESHEDALDKLTMIAQQQNEIITRALVIPATESTSVDIPAAATRASKYLGFDASGNVTVSSATNVSSADDLNYTPSGIGAVATTTQAKLRQYFSITDFGAVGNGSTDETAINTAAQAAVVAAGGGVLAYPPATGYLIDGNVRQPGELIIDSDFPAYAGDEPAGPFRVYASAAEGTGKIAISAVITNGAAIPFNTLGTGDTCAVSGWGYRDTGGTNPMVVANFGARIENNLGTITWGLEVDINNEGATQAINDPAGGEAIVVNTGSTYSPSTGIRIRRATGEGTGPGYLRGIMIDGVREQAITCVAMEAASFVGMSPAAPGTLNVLTSYKSTDTEVRFTINESGGMAWGSGSAAQDTVLERATSGGLTLTGPFQTNTAFYVGSNQVVGARNTGWTAMTGSPDESTAYATSTVTLPQLAGRVAALQAALTTHGLIGA